MTLDPERFSLPADRLREIYLLSVGPRLFRGADRMDHPTAVILGGQPGAGKSPIEAEASHKFQRSGGIVAIIGDDLRAFLPHYQQLQAADDRTAAFYTDRDSGRLVEMAITEASARRVNVLVEGTMRNPDVVARTLGQFRSAGYATDARALAVSPELSQLGIIQRYVAQKESRGVGRMTTEQAHQAALTGMLDTLDRIQDGRLADRLTIYRRGGEPLHRFDLTAPARGDEPRARTIVEDERARPLSPEQRAYVDAELARLTPALERLGLVQSAPVHLAQTQRRISAPVLSAQRDPEGPQR